MTTITKLAVSALVGAALLAATGAEAKTVKQACTKNLATGKISYDVSKFSSDYIIGRVSFHETSRKGGTAYGTCTIQLKFQPPD